MDRRKIFRAVVNKKKPFELDRKKLLNIAKAAAVQLAVGTAALFMQRVALAEAVYPLGISFIAGISQPWSLAAAIGFIVGCILSKTAQSSVYISAAAVVIAVRFLLAQRGKRPQKILVACVVAGTLSLICSRFFVFAAVSALDAAAVLAVICEALLIAVLSIFFSTASVCAERRDSNDDLTAAQRLCVYVCVFCVTLGLCGFTVGHLSIGRVLALICCMLLAAGHLGDHPGSCAFIAAAVVCADSPFYFAAAGCCAAAAVASLFRRYTRTVFTLSFLISALACALLAPNLSFGLIYICELTIACAVYLLIPRYLLERPARHISRERMSDSTAIASARLSAISLSFDELAKLLKKICAVPSKQQSAEALINSVSETVCRDCVKMSECWVAEYSDTLEGFGRLVERLVKSRALTNDDVTALLHNRCVNPISLCGQLNRGYEPLRVSVCRDKNVLVYRSVIQTQFSAVAEMLRTTEKAVCAVTDGDPAVSERIRKSAQALGIEAFKTQYGYADGRLRITLHAKRQPDADRRNALVPRIEQLTGCGVRETQFTLFPGGCCIEYGQTPTYELKTAFRQTGAKSDCGDSFSIFRDFAGNCHIILADGMGTGYDAALDSAVCCAFIRRLLENGFNADSGVKLINSVMSIKDESERAVTVDALRFNSQTGRATLLKAGAAPTFICRKNGVQLYAHPSLPVGIFDELCAKSYEFTLAEGDVAVMMTDGAWSAGGNALSKLLRRSRGKSPEQLASEIVALAETSAQSGDDVTVIAAEVVRLD